MTRGALMLFIGVSYTPLIAGDSKSDLPAPTPAPTPKENFNLEPVNLEKSIQDFEILYLEEVEKLSQEIKEMKSQGLKSEVGKIGRPIVSEIGIKGNQIFQIYTDKIIIPSLIKYFVYLKSLPEDQRTKERFLEIIDILGNYRNKIAKLVMVKQAKTFGKRTMRLQEYIHHDISWGAYLDKLFGIDEINFDKDETCKTLSEKLENAIKNSSFFENLTTNNQLKIQYYPIMAPPLLDISPISPLNKKIGTYQILCRIDYMHKFSGPEKIFIPSIEDIYYHYFHAHFGQPVLNSMEFFYEALTLDSEEKILDSIAKFLFYYSQASVYERGQASIGEWIIHAIAKTQEYNLIFDDSWGGRSKNAMAPDMYALSYLDVDLFVQAFKENTKLQPIKH